MPVDHQNLVGLHQYDGNASFFDTSETVLSQGVGYGILIGFGGFFALICSGLAYFDVTFGGHKDSSEHFQTASRNIKTGLIAACRCCLQIKRKAPNCHTILEVIRLRWGKAAHLIFLYLFFINKLFITSSLIIGSSAVIHALTGGVILVTIMVFMAVTSSGSAEFMAVSSQMLTVSGLSVVTFSLFSGIWSIALIKIGIDINWLFFVICLLVASVFPPISFLLTWNAVLRAAAITAALGGQASAITSWLVATQQIYGELSITTTAASGPRLAGNVAAITVSSIICIVWTLITPDRNASWAMLREDLRANIEILDDAKVIDDEKENPERMAYAYKMTWTWAISLSVVIFVLWPLLALPAGIFPEGYFTFWVILSMIWGLVAGSVAIFLPLFEAREIVEAVFGYGKLADARKRRAATRNIDLPAKPSPSSNVGHADVELGKQGSAVHAKEESDLKTDPALYTAHES